jgi:hypothetical protein
MGGIGSGVKRKRKVAVEECFQIAIGTHVPRGSQTVDETSSGLWRGKGGQPVGYILHRDGDEGWLRLVYQARGEVIQRVIQLRTTVPTYGGLRWWFVCPVTGEWKAKLYLPPGGAQFVSREGGGLTYLSCRESGRYRGLIAKMAKRNGVDASEIRQLVSELGHKSGQRGRRKSAVKLSGDR